ncbi:MAG: homocysteine S-methyltransferase family protein, partial [Candidatus Hydrogenedentota bacterium]
MHFLEALKEQILVFDGATGTEIQARGLSERDFGGSEYSMFTDLITFSRPDVLADIHRQYYAAGAHAIETNSFGASPFRLSEYDFRNLDLTHFAPLPFEQDIRTLSYEDFAYQLSKRAVEIACEARADYMRDTGYDGRPLYVIGSAGPSNRVVSSTEADLKRATFDEMVANFRVQVLGLIDGGADVILFETQQDILETKAAVMGARSAMEERGKRLPIMCQVTVDAFSKMQIFNTDIHAALVTMVGIGIDTFGINCSIGPDLMAKTVEKLAQFSPLPISVIPNAGLPVSENGRTVFKFPPDEMAEYLSRYVGEFGVNIIGGCCGTTPKHIEAMTAAVAGIRPTPRTPERTIFVSGPQQAVPLDSSDGLIMIGERLNVRGSKAVREAVEGDGPIDHHVLEEVIREQTVDLGVRIIDICMDSNVVDTAAALKEVVHKQTTDFIGAMSLDSFSIDALLEAVKVYPGRPIINSISMEEVEEGVTKADAILKATAAHHPMYIALATGPKGPGATGQQKVALAKQLVECAAQHGVTPDQLLLDMNVFPIGSESEEGMNFALESLEAIAGIKAIDEDLFTTCGVGNLTNGLAAKPYMRKVLTSVWLDEARKRGLDAAIVNPNHYVFVQDLDPADYKLGLRVILEHDMDAFEALEDIADRRKGVEVTRRSSYDELSPEEAICAKIKDGYKQRSEGVVELDGNEFSYNDRIVLQTAEAMQRHDPLEFINTHLMKAMNDLGDGFARGEVSLPHLLKSADVMKQVMGFLEAYMKRSAGMDVHDKVEYKGTIVLGTVHQDVHSIGKDLAKTLFENYGYRVIDLGVMTPLQAYIDAAKEHKVTAIGMSALLVQTSNHMIAVSRMMAEQGLGDLPILLGGAPVNWRHAAYVAMAGQDDAAKIRPNVFYCPTAMDGVNVMNKWVSTREQASILEPNREKLLSNLERAKQTRDRDAQLLRELPPRIISFEKYRVPDSPWFRSETLHYSLRQLAPYLDTKTLFALNWKFGGTTSRQKRGETPEKLNTLFEEWINKADKAQWVRPQGVYGIYPCQSEGDEVIVYDPEHIDAELCRFGFTRVLGARRKDTICAAQYFYPRESGKMDAIGVQLTTSGAQVEAQIADFKAQGDSEAALYLQGLSDRVAEDMADRVHALLRDRFGAAPDRGIRWSPGYPAMADSHYNKT